MNNDTATKTKTTHQKLSLTISRCSLFGYTKIFHIDSRDFRDGQWSTRFNTNIAFPPNTYRCRQNMCPFTHALRLPRRIHFWSHRARSRLANSLSYHWDAPGLLLKVTGKFHLHLHTHLSIRRRKYMLPPEFEVAEPLVESEPLVMKKTLNWDSKQF